MYFISCKIFIPRCSFCAFFIILPRYSFYSFTPGTRYNTDYYNTLAIPYPNPDILSDLVSLCESLCVPCIQLSIPCYLDLPDGYGVQHLSLIHI